jgi:hypothetical protein
MDPRETRSCQLPHTSSTEPRAGHRGHRPRSARPAAAARVVVAWSPADGDDQPQSGGFTEVEAQLGPSPAAKARLAAAAWVEALSSARCREVTLTARLGNDLRAKHLVLELAELLTQKLTATRPLIRVLFLPPLDRRAA